MGDPEDFGNFVNAVIDESAYRDDQGVCRFRKVQKDAEILHGGVCDKSKGWFIQPTVVLTTNPHFRTLEEEIFGPVVTLYVYDDNEFAKTLHLVDSTSPYALTGAIFATDRKAVELAERTLRHAAGNFYINDKPTGAVVGQQPFGGGRRRARMIKRAVFRTCCAGPRRARSKRRLSHRRITSIRFWGKRFR